MLALDKEKILEKFSTRELGLTRAEVGHRLKIYGPNRLAKVTRRHVLLEYSSKFTNPLVITLILASILELFAGEIINALIIFSIVFLSATLEFYQEHQSFLAAENLKKRVSVSAEVWREGRKMEIDVAQVTVGDVVLLNLGDIVPADGVVLETRDLHVDESVLTGEAFPVQKDEGSLVLSGTAVVNGEAQMIVSQVGAKTQFGQIAQSLNFRRPSTDFEKGLKSFGFLILRATLVLTIFVFLVNAIFRHSLFDSFLFSLALAVGLTPELLPMIVSANLARGALRLSKKGVIVKSLPAIQNLGAMQILCTDKTGTITQNKIKLEKYEDFLGQESRPVLKLAFLNSFFQSNLKSPLDEAILVHREVSSKGFKKIDEVPFDFERKILSVALKDKDQAFLICKGAPENILERCSFYEQETELLVLTSESQQKILSRYAALSREGFRVLAVARKKVPENRETFGQEDERGLIFVGLTAFLDPPKLEVKEVLKELEAAGVKLKILTGDNELVTRKICQELEIKVEGLLTGDDKIFNDPSKLQARALAANLFVRLIPSQKEAIIKSLRSSGQVVGFLGDGVNDASSLRQADVGISVENAVDVAKEAADLILVTKSLQVLNQAVLEGRQTFGNVRKYIFVGLGSNFGNIFSVILASFLVPFLPLLPVQILLNNLIYDLSQIAIPFDFVDSEVLKRPQAWDLGFIKRFIFIFGPLSSVFDLITFFILLNFFKFSPSAFRTGWFVESLVSQALIILVLRTSRVPFFKSRPHPLLVLSSMLAAALGILITQSALGHFFGFVTLPVSFWVFLIGLLGFYFLSVEVTKIIFYRFQKNRNGWVSR